jgi:Ulp1 family protease
MVKDIQRSKKTVACRTERIQPESINRICPPEWLNDEIVNVCIRTWDSNSKLYMPSSFFMKTLLKTQTDCQWKPLLKWTKKVFPFIVLEASTFTKGVVYEVDFRSLETILLPCNVQNSHWYLIVIYIKQKELVVYDSMGPESETNWQGTKYSEAIKVRISTEALP